MPDQVITKVKISKDLLADIWGKAVTDAELYEDEDGVFLKLVWSNSKMQWIDSERAEVSPPIHKKDKEG